MSAREPEFLTELLGPIHELDAFDSGEAETDEWLRCHALRTQQQGSARTRILRSPDSQRILGFYAVAPHDTHREDLPGSVAGGLTTVPGYLLAQLAVDRSLQGQGVGAELLLDAMATIVIAAEAAGGRLMVVDALHEEVLAFYERFGFIRIGTTLRLYMKISRIRAALEAAGR